MVGWVHRCSFGRNDLDTLHSGHSPIRSPGSTPILANCDPLLSSLCRMVGNTLGTGSHRGTCRGGLDPERDAVSDPIQVSFWTPPETSMSRWGDGLECAPGNTAFWSTPMIPKAPLGCSLTTAWTSKPAEGVARGDLVLRPGDASLSARITRMETSGASTAEVIDGAKSAL